MFFVLSLDVIPTKLLTACLSRRYFGFYTARVGFIANILQDTLLDLLTIAVLCLQKKKTQLAFISQTSNNNWNIQESTTQWWRTWNSSHSCEGKGVTVQDCGVAGVALIGVVWLWGVINHLEGVAEGAGVTETDGEEGLGGVEWFGRVEGFEGVRGWGRFFGMGGDTASSSSPPSWSRA